MFILDVVPLTNIPLGQSQIFSYFSKQDVKRGCLVEVSLNRRKVLATVLKSENVISRKALIKKSDFALKPITKIISSKPLMPPLFFILADFMARYYFCSTSMAIKTILPSRIKSLSKYLEKLPDEEFPEYFKITKPLASKEILKRQKGNIFSNDFSFLIKEIKQCLSKKQQVLILAPTVLHQQYYLDKIKTSLEETVHIAGSDLKVKEFNDLWKKINNQKALLIIGRRSAVFLPWQNLGLIIIIDSNNPAYKSWDQKPYHNAITLVNYLSLYYHVSIIEYQNY